jgi:hypothetical protein
MHPKRQFLVIIDASPANIQKLNTRIKYSTAQFTMHSTATHSRAMAARRLHQLAVGGLSATSQKDKISQLNRIRSCTRDVILLNGKRMIGESHIHRQYHEHMRYWQIEEPGTMWQFDSID